MPHIGRRIRDERVFLAVPLPQSYYQEVRANPSLETLLRISRVIGVTISDLLR